jgi:transcriptional regulator with XRE-family HTH domain
VDEAHQWVAFGEWIAEKREQRGLRRREAAKRAKVSEAAWRDLETGKKGSIGGIKLLPNPSMELLEGVATALEVPVEEVLAHAGRRSGAAVRASLLAGEPDDGKVPLDASPLAIKIRRLSERDRTVVEALVDSMLASEER